MDSADSVIQKIKSEKGLASRIARNLKISRTAVCSWRRVPPRRVLDVESVTGIPRHVIRPDIYPPPRSHRYKPPTSADAA